MLLSLRYAVLFAVGVDGFLSPTRNHAIIQQHNGIDQSSTVLNAIPPPLIITPIIKKMREEKAKKNLPLADRDEAVVEAEGLRVGEKVWKWPPVWPYDDKLFTPKAAEVSITSQQNINNMASMLSGVAQAPTTAVADESEETKFDPIKYWNEEQVDIATDMDPDAVAKLKKHYEFYLRDGMSILEFGAAEESYLPIKPSRHVGVSATQKQMDKNPSLTETLVVDLNNVVKDRDVDDDNLRRLAQGELFDAIIMADTIPYLTNPREVYRSAWYLLKPGGRMIVSFSTKEANKSKFVEAQTKMWRDYNDDQHLWIGGSFFHFSAGEGWENLLGFDISPDNAKKPNQNPIESILDRGKPNNLYVVQAIKGYQDDGINPENLERSINSLCWMLPTMEDRDKKLVVPRLARVYETTTSNDVRDAIEKNIPTLPIIYQSLIKMDTFAFTFAMQAQLACDLICDVDFNASDEQILSLKQGLGLRTPSKEFWVPIGQNTANMEIEDRISLLGYIVPRFGSGNVEQEEALQSFVTGLQPTYKIIRNKCPDMIPSDVELLGTELLSREVLTLGRSNKEEFAKWISALSSDELNDILQTRKNIRRLAKEELDVYKVQKAEEKAQLEEYRRLYDEQVKKAREERSLIFNPRTQKMQVFEQPNKKK